MLINSLSDPFYYSTCYYVPNGGCMVNLQFTQTGRGIIKIIIVVVVAKNAFSMGLSVMCCISLKQPGIFNS